MTKAQLRAYKDLRQERDKLARLIGELEVTLYGPKAPKYDGMPRSGAGAGSPVENIVTKHLELTAAYKHIIGELEAQMRQIEQAIEPLEPRERTLIRLHYFEGLTWEQVAVELGYSWRNIHYIHGKALEKLQGGAAEV